MARKGNKRHVKSISAPKYFGLERKRKKYVVKQNPGRFSKSESVPLLLAVKKITGISIMAELKHTIKSGNVKVNFKVIKDTKFPVGLNDIVEFSDGKTYSISISRNAKFTFSEITPAPSERMQKVVERYKVKDGKTMVRLYDGTIINNDEARVNDTVKVDKDNNISKVIKLGIGSKCFVYSGVHSGETGVVKEILAGTFNRAASVRIESEDGNVFNTLLRNIMAID
ncbi:MAG: hypothetical protein ACP5SA_02580 [Candidatus Micrarchaeia archaeon]